MNQVTQTLETGRGFLVQLGEFMPKLLLAIVILVAGWLVAKFLLFVVIRGLKLVNFSVVTEKAGIDTFLKQGGITKTTSDILGILIYWLAILFTLLIAFETLGLTVVSDLFTQITLFVPNVIVAVIILAIGLYFARFVGDAVIAYAKNVGLEEAELLGRVSRYGIMVFVIVIALDQVDVADDIIRWTFFIIIAGIVFALSLAFGLGGQKWAGGQLDKFVKKERKK